MMALIELRRRPAMSIQLEEPAASILPAIDLDIDMATSLRIDPGGLDGYLKLVGDSRGPLIKYRDGSLTLVSPSHRHERGAERIDGLIKGVCAVLGIGYRATASTLFRRAGFDHGIEADKTYYIEHEPAVRAVTGEIDLTRYPPPDLAVEVVVTHDPSKSLAICQELGVPEVWVYRVRRGSLEFLHRDAQGPYAPAPASRAFSFLTPADVLPWIEPTADEPDNLWEERLRAWVRDELGPRHRGGNEPKA
jgi:Uma2 family endonuclease